MNIYNNIKSKLAKNYKVDEVELKKIIESNHDNCIICLENFKLNDMVSESSCLHFFYEVLL